MLNILGKESGLPLTLEKVREKQVSHVKVVVTHIFMEEVDKVLKALESVMKREKSSIEKGHSERVKL